jgi:tetratricopeptide (TPR) repeat protein
MQCIFMAGALAAPKPLTTVQTANGTVTVRRAGAAAFAALRVNASLSQGDIVRTGANSKAALLFANGSQVRLNANSSVEITAPVAVGRGKQSLFRALGGEVLSRLRPGQAVQTRNAIAGVRGTVIHLKIDPDETATLTVVEGEVEFFNEFGAVIVGETQQSVARAGSAPSAPITIQNAGFIVEWTLDLERALIPREKKFFHHDRRLLTAELQRRATRAQAEPQNVDARRDYGDVLFDGARYEEALQQWQEADRLQPRQAITLSRIGDALQELNQIEEAQAQYQLALAAAQSPRVQTAALGTEETTQNSGQLPALIGLSWLELRRNRPAAAQTVAQKALSSAPILSAGFSPIANAENALASSEARIALGVSLLRQPGKLQEASATLQGALEAEPALYHYQARSWLSLVRLAQEDPAAALKEAQSAVQSAPDSGLAQGNLALVHFYTGNSRAAQRAGQLAVQLNPKSVAARVALGQALLAQGDVDGATETAAQAVALDPSLLQARYLLGVANAGRRDYVHAARELQEAIQLAPDYLPATAALARVYNGMGRPERAVAVLTELMPRHRSNDAVRAALGEVYYEQGKYNEGVEQYREAIRSRPQSALYQAQMARLLLDANRLNEAIVAGRQAVQLAPNIGQYHAILGLSYLYSGLRTQAEREFREALIRDPQNALALAQLAVRTADSTSGFARSGAGLRAGEAARSTQAFLLDPAVSRQLLRGGINTEITPTAGDRDSRGVNFVQRLSGANGQLNSLTLFGRDTDDGNRLNDDDRSLNLEQYATYVADPHTNLYFNLRGLSIREGLAGSEANPDTDDRAGFRFGQAQLAARRRFGAKSHLWAGLFANRASRNVANPGFNSFFDAQTGLPIGQQKVDSDAVQPEVRLDFDFGQPSSPKLFTLGAARARASFDSRRNLLVPIGSRVATDVFDESDRQTLAYAQWTQAVGKRFSFSTQMRYQEIDQSVTRTFTNPGFPVLTSGGRQSRSHLLPSFLATYQPNGKTTFRLFANRRAQDVTSSTFAPTETLLTTESTALPFGFAADPMNLLQLDVERYLSGRDYVKVFAFSSRANNVQIGGANVLGFGGLPDPDAPALLLNKWRGSGLGMRYERQLSRSLFANAGLFLRRTASLSAGAAGAAFSGASAPYEPKRLANLELNHIDPRGNKIGVRMRYNGAFFQDVPFEAARARFPARTYFDLLLSREPGLSNEIFVNVLNVFNARQIDFNGYRSGRRRLEFGVTRRF